MVESLDPVSVKSALGRAFNIRSLDSGAVLTDRSGIYHATKLIRESNMSWHDLGLTVLEESGSDRIVSLESACLWKKYHLMEATSAMTISQWIVEFVQMYLKKKHIAGMKDHALTQLGTMATDYEAIYKSGASNKLNAQLDKIWQLIVYWESMAEVIKKKKKPKPVPPPVPPVPPTP
jgi:hypothetical protein